MFEQNPTNDLPEFGNVEEVIAFAAQHGVKFTTKEIDDIYTAEAQTRDRLEKIRTRESKREKSSAELALIETPRQIKAIEMRSMRFFAFVQAGFTTYGIGLILGLVAVVELFRVAHGVQLFEVSSWLAYAGAGTLVLLNLTLEFLITYVEARAGYHPPAKTDFSLVTVWRRLRYVTGFVPEGVLWEAREKSPAHPYRQFLKVLTWGILFLAVAGSMEGTIAQQPGTWFEALIAIFTESSLSDMMTWVSGLIFAVIVVLGAQHLTRHIAHKAGEAVRYTASVGSDDSEGIAGKARQAAAYSATAILVKKLNKELDRQQPKAVPATSNGHSPDGFLNQPVIYSSDGLGE